MVIVSLYHVESIDSLQKSWTIAFNSALNIIEFGLWFCVFPSGHEYKAIQEAHTIYTELLADPGLTGSTIKVVEHSEGARIDKVVISNLSQSHIAYARLKYFGNTYVI